MFYGKKLVQSIVISISSGVVVGVSSLFIAALQTNPFAAGVLNTLVVFIALYVFFSLRGNKRIHPRRVNKDVTPQPKITGANVAGTIKWYDGRKRYGFVMHEGREIFFHSHGVEKESVRPRENDTVSFVLGTGKRGEQAYNVLVTSSKPVSKKKEAKELSDTAGKSNDAEEKTDKQGSGQPRANNKPRKTTNKNTAKNKAATKEQPQPMLSDGTTPMAQYDELDEGPNPGNSIDEPPAHNQSSVDFSYRSLNYPKPRGGHRK